MNAAIENEIEKINASLTNINALLNRKETRSMSIEGGVSLSISRSLYLWNGMIMGLGGAKEWHGKDAVMRASLAQSSVPSDGGLGQSVRDSMSLGTNSSNLL